MNQKNKLDKTAYILLTISAMIALLISVLSFGLGCYSILSLLGRDGAAGVMFLYITVIGIVFAPALGSWIAHFVLYVLGMRQYKKTGITTARKIGLANCIVSIVGNGFLVGFGFYSFQGIAD